MQSEATRPAPAVGLCGSCGRPLTEVGPNGECLRCLVSLALAAEEEPHLGRRRSTPGPLRYAHFEVEVGEDGFPIELGAGAMAVTYRARDTVLNSSVALKVIDCTTAGNPAARARFLREARAAAQLHHPNVARVTHYGEEGGECFYVMELVEGETLEARVRRDGPLPLVTALEVMEQAARAVAAAEAHGIVHRDIKPANLMIEAEAGGSMLVKVIDYGVAKMTSVQTGLGPDQTQAGFVGTPAFASPEQFAGGGLTTIDTRSDIYSLGVTLWYLLTGRTPFVGRTLEELRARQSDDLPLEQLRDAHVPAPVAALLKSMLAIDPADRPQSARELLAAVHRCHVQFEPGARLRRKRTALAAAAFAVFIALAGIAALWSQRGHSSSAMDRSIAVLPFENLSANPEDQFFTVGIQDQILTKLASVADLKVISRTSTEKYKSKPPNLKTVGQELGVGRVLEGSVQRSGNTVRVNVQLIDTRTDAHVWANTYDRHLDDAFTVESEVANAIAHQLNAKLAGQISGERPSQSTAAYSAYLRGLGLEHSYPGDRGYQEAANAYAEAVRFDPNFAQAWARLSLARSFLYSNGIDGDANSPTTVKEAAERAMALAPESGEAWLAQATYRQRVLRDQAGAAEAYREAEKYLPNSALVQEYLGYADTRLGQWRQAEAHLSKAIELDPRNVRLRSGLGAFVYAPLRRFPEAQAAIDAALQISPNDEHVNAIKADLFQQEGRLDEAAKQLARIPEDASSEYVLNVRAFQAMSERDFDRAIYWTEQATKALKPDQPLSFQNVFMFVTRGYCQEWAGRSDEARATFQRIIDSFASTPGLLAAPGRGMRSYVALAHAGLGDKENALEQAQQAVADYNNTNAIVQPIAEEWLAKIQARFGETEAVLAALPRLQQLPHGVAPGDLRYSPFWDPLRNDPKFQELLDHPPAVRY